MNYLDNWCDFGWGGSSEWDCAHGGWIWYAQTPVQIRAALKNMLSHSHPLRPLFGAFEYYSLLSELKQVRGNLEFDISLFSSEE
jgi:hypothetical protein